MADTERIVELLRKDCAKYEDGWWSVGAGTDRGYGNKGY